MRRVDGQLCAEITISVPLDVEQITAAAERLELSPREVTGRLLEALENRAADSVGFMDGAIAGRARASARLKP
jgi:hypothetical protein